MRKTLKGAEKTVSKETEPLIIEKNFHRSNKQRILHILCLFIPIGAAFGGYFIATPLWSLLSQETPVPEYFKFISSIVVFAIPTILIFILTRKENPIMKMGIFTK